MSEYAVTVVDYPATRLVGMKVRTTMAKAQEDCSAIWQNFGPRIGTMLAAGHKCKDSYGVSVMIDAEAFDYWAAIDAGSAKAVPEGMGAIDIPAGKYAKVTVPSLKKLTEGYMFLYAEWPKRQREYVPGDQAPCFELYPANWQLADAFEIYMPVKKA